MASTQTSFVTTVTKPVPSKARPDDADSKPHHATPGKVFKNPWPSFVYRPGRSIGLELVYRSWTGKAKKMVTEGHGIPVQKATFLPSRHIKSTDAGKDAASSDGRLLSQDTIRATWLGHACFYVEFPSGLRVLFDPVFEDRCSPVSWFGPRRFTEVPTTIADIPFVDACFISHAHYDHLSQATVLRLKEKHPNCHFFVGLGIKKFFTGLGIDKCTELDWWEDAELRVRSEDTADKAAAAEIAAQVSCLPAQHASNRGAFDENHSLWASWAVCSGGKSVWFAGDTGYRAISADIPEEARSKYTPELHRRFPCCPAFKQIGELKGPFDLGLLPIGAYEPRLLFSSLHSNPYDSVNIFVDTRCRRALAMHWGTWDLATEEAVMEPPEMLKEALRSKKLPETGVFDTCGIGESVEV
ncbi:uncharacterized protein E0L32_004028 [Thyridium curvatum]|uniref:Metallo-beta-lactamase domain-containing protein n=1 Tax=Thyridium curvatum TaxID=1093900 RepID=A0A507BGD1_9PEZI|nr:uncharacterized protein E0L32_004028 [Thyridium curvatum]TPX16379.1 hypothetical protein E0L32_004028 [Thyridium curvatum]